MRIMIVAASWALTAGDGHENLRHVEDPLPNIRLPYLPNHLKILWRKPILAVLAQPCGEVLEFIQLVI